MMLMYTSSAACSSDAISQCWRDSQLALSPYIPQLNSTQLYSIYMYKHTHNFDLINICIYDKKLLHEVPLGDGRRSCVRVPSTLLARWSLCHLAFQVWLSIMYTLQTSIYERDYYPVRTEASGYVFRCRKRKKKVLLEGVYYWNFVLM